MEKNKVYTLEGIYTLKDPAEFIAEIDRVQTEYQLPIISIVLTSEGDLLSLFEKKKFYNFHISYITKNSSFASLGLSFTKKDSVINGKFAILKTESPGVYLLVSHEGSIFIREALSKLLSKLYPYVSQAFLSSYKLLQMLRNLHKNHPEKTIRLRKIVSKCRILQKGSRKKIESEIKWTDLPYEDAFRIVFENDGWINNVDFELIYKKQYSEHDLFGRPKGYYTKETFGSLSRTGIFKCKEEFLFFYQTVIKDICEFAIKNINLLKDRARVKVTNYQPKPIIIEYDEDIFKDKTQNKKLTNIISNLPQTAVSAFHSNPYLHLSILDYQDLSSYDLWVLSNKRIVIVPQMKSSYISLNRLCNQILTSFKEGEIKDFSEIENATK
ncbi:MAG: hypothetical protein AB1632_05030 [Nitrospirota bacterium]